ncbi:MAG: hypothetical protein JNK57_04995 [Planctomycetaceae bacterium]|nr:hypothetical protein [Planctomycetaceae bacterium]
MPDERWVMVDCYLPKHNGVRKRFFEFLDQHQIKDLAVVFQTHPDYDHYLGMHDVLAHFIGADDKSVGHYVDSGLNAQQIKRLLVEPKRPGRDEYQKLHKALQNWHKDGNIFRHYGLDAERPPISPKGYRGKIDFIPIAPDPTTIRNLTELGLESYRKNPQAKLEANDLSLILVLAVKIQNTEFNVLLSADAGIESITNALRIWGEHASENGISDRFRVIKLAHHGSIKNYVPELSGMFVNDGSSNVAAVSAGERVALPDRQVLASFLKSNWIVMTTTVRRKRQFDRVVGLHLKRDSEVSFEERTISLRWNENGELSFGPPDATVASSELDAYASAKQ